MDGSSKIDIGLAHFMCYNIEMISLYTSLSQQFDTDFVYAYNPPLLGSNGNIYLLFCSRNIAENSRKNPGNIW